MSDRNIKDLLGRMTEMSPEPPDFPDGIQTLQPVPPPRRSGAWVFGVAGLAVLALALPFVFWQGDPGRTASSGESTTTIPEPTTTLYVGEDLAAYTVFLVQNPEGSYTGNPTLVPVQLTTRSDWTEEGFASFGYFLAWMGREDSGVTVPDGFYSAIPTGVEVITETEEIIDGRNVVVLDMNERFLDGAGGLLADFTMLNQFIYTASVIPERAVLFTFNGEPIEAFGSEGLSLVDPVDRATFLDHLNLIIITTRPYEVDGVITIEGKANLFEATVSYRTMGPDGPGKSGYTTATCGTGCWGDFEVTIEAADLPADGWIEVFGESAKDGSHENVVVIPGSMIWQVEGGFAERPALGD